MTKTVPHCCFVFTDMVCVRAAKWTIVHGPDSADVTESCTAHVGEMLTDAAEHRIYQIKTGELKHDVVHTDSCYACRVCAAAAGDGDGLVGAPCPGPPPAKSGWTWTLGYEAALDIVDFVFQMRKAEVEKTVVLLRGRGELQAGTPTTNHVLAEMDELHRRIRAFRPPEPKFREDL